jgi:hypothetical protein
MCHRYHCLNIFPRGSHRDNIGTCSGHIATLCRCRSLLDGQAHRKTRKRTCKASHPFRTIPDGTFDDPGGKRGTATIGMGLPVGALAGRRASSAYRVLPAAVLDVSVTMTAFRAGQSSRLLGANSSFPASGIRWRADGQKPCRTPVDNPIGQIPRFMGALHDLPPCRI